MIIGISGKKQAGKTTVANIIHGEILKAKSLLLIITLMIMASY